MGKPIIGIVVLVFCLVFILLDQARDNSFKKKAEQIKHFLRAVVVNLLEKDYKRYTMRITAVVTKPGVDRIKSGESLEYIFYSAQGGVSYIIREKRRAWLDQEGNRIRLGPETVITHTFTRGVREDR